MPSTTPTHGHFALSPVSLALWEPQLHLRSHGKIGDCEQSTYADILWARHAIFLPHERLLKRMGTFLTLCSKRSAGEHVEITEEPIGAWLLFNRKPIISCDRTTPKRVIYSFPMFLICTLWKTDSKSLLRVWKKIRKKASETTVFYAVFR